MTSHTVDLYGTPHVLISAVLSPGLESNHPYGSEMEARIKRGDLPPLDEFMHAISGFALGEQYYLLACYVTWAEDAQFNAMRRAIVMDGVSVPLELPLADANRITFGDTTKEPEDRYDTYNYSLQMWRTRSMSQRGTAPADPDEEAAKEPVGSPLYLWLDKVSRCGLPDVEHAARVLKDYYEGVDASDPRSLTQQHAR